MRTLESRKRKAPEGSYTQRLFNDDRLLCAKLLEEAGELNEAVNSEDVAWEAADVIYFTLVKCAKAGVSLANVEKIASHAHDGRINNILGLLRFSWIRRL
eukprot:m.24251 g.24251  ORF g.24251 m.24251 type:complete len:100 (+) comp28581_c0_seq4:1076-1375(+)